MKIISVSLSALVLVLFSGCASMFVPDSEQINKLQVVKMGSKKPIGNEYVLHIPAGSEIPVQFSIKGSFISQPVDNQHITKLNQDLYVYKYWASLDGKKWKPTGKILEMPITINVDSVGGKVEVKVDLLK